ncbi:MAG: alpha/beta fold hydrolase, partial [Planctomycetota bacterium]
AMRHAAKVLSHAFDLRCFPGFLARNRALAEVITRDQPSSEIMVRFSSAREGTLIACAHAGGDHAIYYRFLAKHLAGEHPVVAFQSEGLQGGVPQSSIEGLAAANVQQLLDEYPHHPVCLVGYCVGAVVALEMAGQLERHGHAVRGVIVIDSPIRRDVRNLRDWAHFSSLRPQWLAPVRYGMYHLGLRPLKWALEDLVLYTKGSADGRREFYRRRVERATLRAFTRYQPQPVYAPIHLVRSSWRADRSKYDLDVAGWQGLSRSGFTHETLPADHEQMLLEPAVEQLAARVRQRLSAAAPRTAPVTP